MQASNYLTNFSFELLYEIFTEDASLLFLYDGAKKSKMTKSSNQRGSCLKPRAKNLIMYLHVYCLKLENYPGFSKKAKDTPPLAKSQIARSAARQPLLGWRCALVRKVRCSTYLRLASVGCSKNVMLAKRRVCMLCWAFLVFFFNFFFFAEPCFHQIFLFGMRRISGRNHSLNRSSLSRR